MCVDHLKSQNIYGLTMHISVLCHGVDVLVSEDLDVLAAGPAVELVGANQPPTCPVRHSALLAHMLCEIWWGLNAYL